MHRINCIGLQNKPTILKYSDENIFKIHICDIVIYVIFNSRIKEQDLMTGFGVVLSTNNSLSSLLPLQFDATISVLLLVTSFHLETSEHKDVILYQVPKPTGFYPWIPLTVCRSRLSVHGFVGLRATYLFSSYFYFLIF